ncbi:MAG: hypothetical protein ANABAC_1588 [Anaerolineae bacterium]|nr:MAG: hypothetical protein ANABAC_1588 [Anaerolineae bacterium]
MPRTARLCLVAVDRPPVGATPCPLTGWKPNRATWLRLVAVDRPPVGATPCPLTGWKPNRATWLRLVAVDRPSVGATPCPLTGWKPVPRTARLCLVSVDRPPVGATPCPLTGWKPNRATWLRLVSIDRPPVGATPCPLTGWKPTVPHGCVWYPLTDRRSAIQTGQQVSGTLTFAGEQILFHASRMGHHLRYNPLTSSAVRFSARPFSNGCLFQPLCPFFLFNPEAGLNISPLTHASQSPAPLPD